MIELRGEHVVLRTMERAHCRELWEAYEPTTPLPTEPLNPGLSVEGADRWFEEIQAKQGKEQVYLGVFALNDRLVGDIQLANIDWRHRTASIGLGIARQADRGCGMGTDAAQTLLRYAFHTFFFSFKNFKMSNFHICKIQKSIVNFASFFKTTSKRSIKLTCRLSFYQFCYYSSSVFF